MNEKFIEYEPVRDVVLVLGAGASYADGAPLKKGLLPYILGGSDPALAASEIAQGVSRFILENFRIESGAYPSLESVFGYLDYFIEHQESLGGIYSTSRIQEIKESLIKLIHYAIGHKPRARAGVYHQFWETVRQSNRNISILTLNYDTLLDEAFNFLYPEHAYIDYCIHLMNFDYTDEIGWANWWRDVRKPVPVKPGTDPRPVKIIKLHGSLNWKFCNCCNQVLLTPWNTDIDLKTGGFLRYENSDSNLDRSRVYEYLCPLDKTRFQTLIVPPTHLKNTRHPVIVQLMEEAAREIRKCRKVVFIGYSFSDADVHIKALFKKNLRPGTPLIVVNSQDDPALKQAYASLGKIEFIPLAFEEVVTDADLMRRLCRHE
jgi:NAD-dependent SIR2 family protein deacetylase